MSDFKMTPEQKGLFDKLTSFQKRMALNDIAGMKPAENHKDAGGTCKTESNRYKLASEILTKPVVLAFLDSMKAAAVSDAVMSREEMMERLSMLSRTGINDLIEWAEIDAETSEGEPIKQSVWMVKPSVMQDPVKMAAIAELAATKDGIKIKTHSNLAAMNQLADLAGYKSAQKHDHTVKSVSMEISENTSPQDAADIYKTLLGE